ncbi:MAG: hypothetical protein WC114_05980 [Smithellaceae bacterium]
MFDIDADLVGDGAAASVGNKNAIDDPGDHRWVDSDLGRDFCLRDLFFKQADSNFFWAHIHCRFFLQFVESF